jgi:hypothetical protein
MAHAKSLYRQYESRDRAPKRVYFFSAHKNGAGDEEFIRPEIGPHRFLLRSHIHVLISVIPFTDAETVAIARERKQTQ